MKFVSQLLQLSALISGIWMGVFLSHSWRIRLNFYQTFMETEKPSNVSAILNEEVKILCWIMTNPNSEYKWKHIVKLLGGKCSKVIFVSSKTKYHNNEHIEVVGVPVGRDSRDSLWAKTKEAFVYCYRNYYDEYDWFMKMDDDACVTQ